MPKIDHVISQIQSQIPRYTNDFCDEANITSVSLSGTSLIIEVDTVLEQDTVVNVKDIFVKNNLVSASTGTETGTYIITLENDHDITYSEIEIELGVQKTVTFVGDFDGDYLLTEVPASNQITIECSLAPTGSSYILESYNYSGRKSITWINSTTLTYDTGYTLEPASNNGVIQNNIRVDGVSSDQDIIDLLENKAIKLTKNTMFVVLDDVKASKSRFTYSDAFNRKEYKDDLHIEASQNFSVYTVIPTHTKTTPRTAINYIHTFRPYIIKSLQGALFDSGFVSSNKFLCAFYGDSGEQYNKAYYVHRFDFETVFNIESDDCLPIEDTRAFVSFELGINMQFDDYEDEKKSIEDNLL